MTILGRDESGQNIWLPMHDRLTGMYIIGANGTGKTTMLENMIVEDMEAGMGLAVLDPHGDLIGNIINRCPQERLQDVILLDPLDVDYPFGLNLFECDNTDDILAVEHAVNSIIGVYEKVFNMSVAETPRLSQYIRQVSYALVGSGYTMAEIPYLLLDTGFRSSLTHLNENLFWKTYKALRPAEQLDRSESTIDRIDSLLSNRIIRNIVGQSKTTINFRAIMDTGKILLVSLSARYESLTSLLGSIIIGQLLTAALNRATTSKRRQFNLYADEYQRFSTPDFSTLLTEARKFGVATTIAHQVRSQLDEKNAATALQAGSLVVFRVTAEDAEELAPSFNLTPKAGDLIERPVRTPAQNVIEALISKGSHEDPRVNQYVQTYLKPLVDATNERIEKARYSPRPNENEIFPRKTYPEGSYAYNPKLIKEELYILNAELFAAMTNRKTTGLDYHRQWAAFAQYLGCSHYKHHKEVKNYRSWDTMMVLNLMELLLEKGKEAPGEVILDLMGQLKAPLFYRHQISLDPEEQIFPLEVTFFYTLLPVSTDMNDLFHVAKTILAAEKERLKAYTSCFIDMLEGIKNNPILMDSGKYEQAEGPRQGYADRAKEVANELVHLPRGHARVKIPSGEYLMETIVPQTSRKDYQRKRQQIVDTTRTNYCKPRHEVEEEIRRRQRDDEPPPPTRKHEL